MRRIVPRRLRTLGSVLRAAVVSWIAHRAGSKSAALAFYTLFSLTPILLLTIAVAGYFFGTQAARGEIVAQIQGLTGPNGAQAIQALLAAARDPGTGTIATLVAAGFLVIGATTVFVELKSSLDELWEVARPRASSATIELLKVRMLSLGMIMALAFLFLVSLVVSAVLAVLEDYAGGFLHDSAIALSWISSLFTYCIIASLFAVIYKTLPDAPLSWHDVWIGAGVTSGLFILGKNVIGIYLGNSGVASGFGAAGSVVALLLWLYYSAQVFFLGAEFTRQYALTLGSLKRPEDCERRAVATPIPDAVGRDRSQPTGACAEPPRR